MDTHLLANIIHSPQLFGFALAAVATWCTLFPITRIAKRLKIMDVPSHRSSHAVPTPRIGGIGIMIGTVIATAVTCNFTASFGVAVAGGAIVGIVSFMDDLFSLPSLPRLLVHLLGAGLLIYCIGLEIPAFGLPFDILGPLPKLLGLCIATLFIVGFLNIFNFMDGINGISSAQGAIGGITLSMLFALHANSNSGIIAAILAGGCLGFLPHNFPTARTFMGDMGSTVLGFCLAVLTVIGAARTQIPWVAFLLPFSLYLYDGIFTIFKRISRRERITVPHREHHYQLLVRSGWSHPAVTGLYTIQFLACSVLALGYATTDSELLRLGILLMLLGWFVLFSLYVHRHFAQFSQSGISETDSETISCCSEGNKIQSPVLNNGIETNSTRIPSSLSKGPSVPDTSPIPLSSQDITDAEIQAVTDVLRGDQLCFGPRTEAFEAACAAASGRKYGVAVNSGTSALHLCVRGLEISEGDEVITTPFSFVATTNCILFERAKPVFVDIDPESYNMDPAATEAAITENTKALLPAEIFGNTAHFDTYEEIAKRHDLKMIEDSCEALGGRLGERRAGSFGDCGALAFYPNKQITTGEGGMFVTNDKSLRDMARALRNQGRHPRDPWLQHSYMGYNYRMSEMTAAIGDVQLSRLDEILGKRRQVSNWYDQALTPLVEQGLIHLPPMESRDTASFFVYVIRLADSFTEADRDDVRAKLSVAGIANNCYFVPIHYQPYIQETLSVRKGQFPIAERIAERTIAIPFFSNMTESQVAQVVDTLTEILTA